MVQWLDVFFHGLLAVNWLNVFWQSVRDRPEFLGRFEPPSEIREQLRLFNVLEHLVEFLFLEENDFGDSVRVHEPLSEVVNRVESTRGVQDVHPMETARVIKLHRLHDSLHR